MQPQLIIAGEFILNPKNRKIYYKNRQLQLRNKQFELMDFLLRNHQKALSRGTILEQVWERDLFCTTNTVDVHISSLRKLTLNSEEKSPIKTIRGFGYILE